MALGTFIGCCRDSSEAPLLLMPDPASAAHSAGCVPTNKISSVGFLAFVLSVMNGVISAVNNINDNNNNNNNNNNDNNQNNNNVNVANLANSQTSTSMITVPGIGRELFDAVGSLFGSNKRQKRSSPVKDLTVVWTAARASYSMLNLWYAVPGENDQDRIWREFCLTNWNNVARSGNKHFSTKVSLILSEGAISLLAGANPDVDEVGLRSASHVGASQARRGGGNEVCLAVPH